MQAQDFNYLSESHSLFICEAATILLISKQQEMVYEFSSIIIYTGRKIMSRQYVNQGNIIAVIKENGCEQICRKGYFQGPNDKLPIKPLDGRIWMGKSELGKSVYCNKD